MIRSKASTNGVIHQGVVSSDIGLRLYRDIRWVHAVRSLLLGIRLVCTSSFGGIGQDVSLCHALPFCSNPIRRTRVSRVVNRKAGGLRARHDSSVVNFHFATCLGGKYAMHSLSALSPA